MNSVLEISIPDPIDPINIYGFADENIRVLQDHFHSRITVRDRSVSIEGDMSDIESISAIISDAIKRSSLGMPVSKEDILRAIEITRASDSPSQDLRSDVILEHKGTVICPKGVQQKSYVRSIRENTITFGIGPAGTGKTYLAMAMALSALKRKQVGRIILSRPIVEAGENLGFLPGTLTEKVDPYIRPLYDALFDMCDADTANYYLDSSIIEIAPLAFMRGRTLNDSFVILDEAQNTTPEQMKMFLTRLGVGSKMVVTGDVTQIDIGNRRSGLLQVEGILDGIEKIGFCYFSGKDVIRNSLVSEIIKAYEADGKKRDMRAASGEECPDAE